MQLKKISYSELMDTSQAWSLDGLQLGPKNLLVGKNAAGKSRTLNVIGGLARNLTAINVPVDGRYTVVFANNDGTDCEYQIDFKDHEVVLERLTMGSETLLERGPGGVGKIKTMQLESQMIDFQAPSNMIAAVARRDSLQHPFLEPLYQWASTLKHYRFGTQLGKDHFAVLIDSDVPFDDADQNKVIGVFIKGKKKFGQNFVNSLIADMQSIGYAVSDVDIAKPVSVNIQNAPDRFTGLYVQELDRGGVTDQVAMSQGMFRVLALLIHVNYAVLENNSACILIDDIGEGLDFDRSCRLLKVLRDKADTANLQLIMSTNDRFIMNEVPLDEWSVLQRAGGVVTIRNIQNSRDSFEEFKFTGLSNFSFLEMDFVNSEPLEAS